MLFCGCTKVLTDFKPYSTYVGKEIAIERDVYLLELKEDLRGVGWLSSAKQYAPGEMYQMIGKDDSVNKAFYTEIGEKWILESYKYILPKGSRLIINDVVWKQFDGSERTIAIGQVYLDQLNKYVPFEFEWPGLSGKEYSAPWEQKKI
jgi:hypothetical protein